MSTLRVEVPRKLKPLLAPCRYKGAYGGRGGAKSHFFAEQIILRCFTGTERWVCIREVQNSLRESVRQLLLDKINKFGLSSAFQALEAEIRGPNGSLITFKGMQHYNAEGLKSLEGYDGAWVEEAQTLSAASLRVLRPTMRKPGSELWFSWNPKHPNDAVDEFFRGEHVSPEAIAVPVGWQDNPWFPDVLRKDMEHDYRANPDMAEHVWGGGYLVVAEGAYYGALLSIAERENRVTAVAHDPALPVHRAWDLGVGDSTVIWWFQVLYSEIRVIDWHEANGVGLEHYAKVIRDRGYPDGIDWMPHDARVRELGTGRTRIETWMSLGFETPRIVPMHKVDDGINAVRQTLPRCWFDFNRCRRGLERLRQYRRAYDERLKVFSDTPLHDWTSHTADAFRYLAMAWRELSPADRPVTMKEKLAELVRQPTLDEMLADADAEEW